jgi:hypothetical protein
MASELRDQGGLAEIARKLEVRRASFTARPIVDAFANEAHRRRFPQTDERFSLLRRRRRPDARAMRAR